MPFIPLTSRTNMYDEQSGVVEALLVTITHSSLPTPIRLSSDPTQRISLEPLEYGTVSNGNTFKFVFISAIIPDDQKGAPPRAALVFDNISSDHIELLRSFTDPAVVDLRVVLAASPNFYTQVYTGLRLTSSTYDESSITLDISREPVISEPFGRRQTKQRLPGIYGILSS